MAAQLAVASLHCVLSIGRYPSQKCITDIYLNTRHVHGNMPCLAVSSTKDTPWPHFLMPYKLKFSRDLCFKNFAGKSSIREI